MAFSDDEATKRSNAVASVNVALHELHKAEGRLVDVQRRYRKVLNDAQSQIGTARAELIRVLEQYEKKRTHLFSLVPELLPLE